MEEIKRLVLNQESEEDQVVSLSLRPERLVDFVGQPDLVKGLQVAIAASQKRGEPWNIRFFQGRRAWEKPLWRISLPMK